MRAATAVCVLLALAWTLSLEITIAWGWDETMHSMQPAWRLWNSIQRVDPVGFFRALHDCDRYPFVYPLLLAFQQGLTGISERGARVFGTLVWCATLLVLYVAARRAEPKRLHAAWFALAFAAASPLALSFAGTALLETPAAAAIALALWSWIRRRDEDASDEQRAVYDRRAGFWAALALFTKFNYGLLLWAGLALDELLEWIARTRAGGGRKARASTARAAFWPLALTLWWFVLPLPMGLDIAAEHRGALVEWLSGNQDQLPTSWRIKLLNAATFFAPNPRTLVVIAIGAVVALWELRRPAVRAAWCVFIALAAGVLSHRFHLPRFLIPLGPALWLLAGVGWARLLPRERLLRWPLVAALTLACAIAPTYDSLSLADRLGFFSADPAVRAYQTRELSTQCDLSGGRRLRSLGLNVEASHAFFECIAAHIASSERVGWIDLTEEVSPAGLQYGLAHAGRRERRMFATQLWDENYISIAGVDPKWSDLALHDWALRYDVLLYSEPHHLRGRRGREFFGDYVERLEAQGWTRRALGRIQVERPMQPPLEVALFSLRPEL